MSSAKTRNELLDKLARDAIGLHVEYPLATGKRQKRIYLDSTASTLRLGVVQDALDKYMPHYSNTHSLLHFGARLSTVEYEWVHDMVLKFCHADPEVYTAFFAGAGATTGFNRIARTLREKRPDRDVVITTIMEHHSNDLPHRKHFPEVVHIPAQMADTAIGQIHLGRLADALEKHGDRVNYVALTGVSNVTGIINPIHEVAKLAHAHGALVVVDAAQMAAHVPMFMCHPSDPECNLDILVFSGHKIYAPGSPGVVVTRKDLFAGQEPQEVGGGVVDDVYINRYMIMDKFPDREEAGTPNIVGAIGLGAALYALDRVGMDVIAAEEHDIICYTLARLNELGEVLIYGERDPETCQRAGAVSFNIRGLDHALTAAALNDYFGISCRNQCFCAHPYVREMITEALSEEAEHLTDEELETLAELHRGMVRASFGIYNTREDVDALVAAIRHICENKSFYEEHYDALEDGHYEHKTYRFEPKQLFSVRGAVDDWLGS